MLSTRDFETLFQHIQKEKKSNFVFVLKKHSYRVFADKEGGTIDEQSA